MEKANETLKCHFHGVRTKEPMSENIFIGFLVQFYVTYEKTKKFVEPDSEIRFFENKIRVFRPDARENRKMEKTGKNQLFSLKLQ